MNKGIIDISPTVSPSLGVWPGDTKPTREVLMHIENGESVTLSTIHTTVHLGAHADATNHFSKDGCSIEAMPLDVYIGPCQVMHVETRRHRRITMADLPGRVDAERLLISMGTFDSNEFNEDFSALDPELVNELGRQGVKLIGVDSPSVDLFESRDLPTHQAFLKNNIAILEGLTMSGVQEGKYELVALPLKLEGFDASPVRAILRELSVDSDSDIHVKSENGAS